jgi:putative secretion ATPase (PEP-CTERM system associated)
MYDEFYGFSGRPFQLTPDPAFYFESATHRKALSYLGYGLGQGEGFVVVTGEVGAGKSTLVAHLMATIDRQRLTAGQIVTSALDGAELVHVAAQAFGLGVAGKDKAGALHASESFLQAEARAGRRCLLVVDEAQSLSQPALEELRMLSNFQLGAHPLLQILLLGQPEFRKVLADDPALEQLRQRVIATHHLEPMNPEEVGAYVEHRLGKVGWTGNPAFDREVYLALAEATGGIPRRINQVASRLLLLGAVERAERIDGALLAATLDDMARDGAAPAPKSAEPEVVAFPPREARRAEPADSGASREEIVAAFGERDALIVELQQAVIELSEAIAHGPAPAAPAGDGLLAGALAALEQRVAGLENRLFEQEHILRHTLTMLIEWIEDDPQARAA